MKEIDINRPKKKKILEGILNRGKSEEVKERCISCGKLKPVSDFNDALLICDLSAIGKERNLSKDNQIAALKKEIADLQSQLKEREKAQEIELTFGLSLKTKIVIKNGKITDIVAVDGYGARINKDMIDIDYLTSKTK